METATVINEIIQTRRSVKTNQFKAGALIPDEVIRQALENATWAPNHGKTEPWHFVVFKGEGIRQLCEFQAALYKQESGEKFTEAKYRKLLEDYLKCSHVIAICLKRDETSRIPEIEEVAAVAAAVQNLSLTLHAYGYGGYWTTGGITYYDVARPFFQLGSHDKLMGFYLTGVMALPPNPSVRRPLEEKTTWVTG